MSGRSIDGELAVGRTGWDILASGRRTFLAALMLILLVVILLVRPDAVSSAVDAIKENAVYALPILGGWFFGRHLYRTYLRQVVIVQVEDPEHNVQAEYEVSRQRFERFVLVDGIANPVSTRGGSPLYRFMDFDPSTMEGRAAWCHDPETELASVLLVRERWEALVRHDHDSTLRAEELATIGYHETYSHARRLVNDALDSLVLDKVQYGLDDDPEDRDEGSTVQEVPSDG